MTQPEPGHVPRRRSGTSVRHGSEGAAIVDDAGALLVSLDDVAAALWELCDGDTDVDEITDAVCAVWDVDREVAQRDVRQTLGVLRDAGVLVWDDHP